VESELLSRNTPQGEGGSSWVTNALNKEVHVNSHKWKYIDGVVFHCVRCGRDSDKVIDQSWDVGEDCDGAKDIDVIMDMVDQWRVEAEEENVGKY
jgi:hypothetical protein